MSSQVSSSEFSPMMTSLREGFRKYLPESSEAAKNLLSSTALLQSFFGGIRTLPYALLPNEFGVNDCWHMLSARVTFTESTLICLVSALHNLFFALIYTILVIATLFFSQTLNDDCSRHWTQATYGVVSGGINVVGILSPYFGTGLTVLFFRSIWRTLKKNYQHDVNLFERPFLREVKTIFQKNRTLIFNYARAKVDESRYQKEFLPSLKYIAKRLNETEKMDELMELIMDFWRRFPKMDASNHSRLDESIFSMKLGSPAAQDHYDV